MPATAGGITTGKATSVSTARAPGPLARASHQASGVPRPHDDSQTDHRRDQAEKKRWPGHGMAKTRQRSRSGRP